MWSRGVGVGLEGSQDAGAHLDGAPLSMPRRRLANCFLYVRSFLTAVGVPRPRAPLSREAGDEPTGPDQLTRRERTHSRLAYRLSGQTTHSGLTHAHKNRGLKSVVFLDQCVFPKCDPACDHTPPLLHSLVILTFIVRFTLMTRAFSSTFFPPMRHRPPKPSSSLLGVLTPFRIVEPLGGGCPQIIAAILNNLSSEKNSVFCIKNKRR